MVDQLSRDAPCVLQVEGRRAGENICLANPGLRFLGHVSVESQAWGNALQKK